MYLITTETLVLDKRQNSVVKKLDGTPPATAQPHLVNDGAEIL